MNISQNYRWSLLVSDDGGEVAPWSAELVSHCLGMPEHSPSVSEVSEGANPGWPNELLSYCILLSHAHKIIPIIRLFFTHLVHYYACMKLRKKKNHPAVEQWNHTPDHALQVDGELYIYGS